MLAKAAPLRKIRCALSRRMHVCLTAILVFVSAAPLSADDDRAGAAFLPLSIHPGNQRHMAKYYDHRLDDSAILIYTPGTKLWYDHAAHGDAVSHARVLGAFLQDCADMPAGYAAVCGVLPILECGPVSASGILGAGVFARRNWKYSRVGHSNSILFNAGQIQWAVGPYPEFELQCRLPGCRARLVADVFTVLYVSALSFGLSIPIE